MKASTIIRGMLMLALAGSVGACNRPTEEECGQAIDKIRELMGTAEDETGASRAAAIRSCRGNADKASVRCVLAAESIDDLKKCEGDIAERLFKDDAKKPAEPAGQEPSSNE